jgi:hypothetical protein
MNSPSRLKLGSFLLALVIAAGFSNARCSRKRDETTEGTAAQSRSDAHEEASQPAESLPKEPGSTLEIGAARRDPGQVISIPLEFSSGPHESVGLIDAELDVKEGPWKFQKARLPEGSHGKISAKPRRAKDSAGGSFVIQLEISSGSREIGDGVVGYLTFSTSDSSTSEIPVTLGKLETYPPESESEQPQRRAGAPSELPSTPDEATPSPSCFFFTH